VHFYLKLEVRGAWVLFIHFLLLLYFVNVLLFFKTFAGGRGHGFFFHFLKKKNLEGGKGVGRGLFFLHFLLLFYYFEVFCYFLFIFEAEGGNEFFFIFSILQLGKWVWVSLYCIFF